MNYTTIEQSKKLLELGMNPESADMFYLDNSKARVPILGEYKIFDIPSIKHINSDKLISIDMQIPCWSLSALLELMPPYLFEWERGIDLNIYRNLNGKGWHVSYMPNNIESMQKDKFRQITNGNTPLEAAFNMVVWLLENGYIKTEK